ncbi:hypothetical protein NUM_11350 [Actinocatenispora comari]|uniref:Uncharacterized protein n=1 Tax=Actinocatenispora comari TaxID=2807577 RepID=A0A8J4EJ31_9ACTN|nr:hypothetical protein NUM_11350 [Actinocatenispora comari]
MVKSRDASAGADIPAAVIWIASPRQGRTSARGAGGIRWPVPESGLGCGGDRPGRVAPDTVAAGRIGRPRAGAMFWTNGRQPGMLTATRSAAAPAAGDEPW